MSDDEKTEGTTPEENGTFMKSLIRTNKQIKHDRAEVIAEGAQLRYRREIEDMEIQLKDMQRERTNMLDLSAENTHSLMLGKDFNAPKFVDRDIELGVDMRNLGIKLKLAKERYTELFGGKAGE